MERKLYIDKNIRQIISTREEAPDGFTETTREETAKFFDTVDQKRSNEVSGLANEEVEAITGVPVKETKEEK